MLLSIKGCPIKWLQEDCSMKILENLLFDKNGDYSSDKIEDDNYIPSDNDGEIDEVIIDLVLSDQNTTEKDPVMSKSVLTIFTSRNKSEQLFQRWHQRVDLVFII